MKTCAEIPASKLSSFAVRRLCAVAGGTEDADRHRTLCPQQCTGGSALPRSYLFVSGRGRSTQGHFYPNTPCCLVFIFLTVQPVPCVAVVVLGWRKALRLALNKPCCSERKEVRSRCRSKRVKRGAEPLVALAGREELTELLVGKSSLLSQGFRTQSPPVCFLLLTLDSVGLYPEGSCFACSCLQPSSCQRGIR